MEKEGDPMHHHTLESELKHLEMVLRHAANGM
jgi:hypothetical protein